TGLLVAPGVGVVSVMSSHAIATDVAVADPLAGVVHEKAGRAYEVVGASRNHTVGRVGAGLGHRLFFVLVVLFVVARGDAIFEDRVEVGLDIVWIDDIFVLALVVGRTTFTGRRRHLFFLFLLDEGIGDLVVD